MPGSVLPDLNTDVLASENLGEKWRNWMCVHVVTSAVNDLNETNKPKGMWKMQLKDLNHNVII